ncbi:MAG TPA: YbfB/YjiJ family MFS transporter [Stellaceae bacterium]|jgi:predicted MFS family arabinose efflux permease|nr:YbfB/YjiJ family MFS transporter [Stellaceae bacterium]
MQSAEIPPLRATIAALCANLVGIGIARFGYTPLIPALIAAGWFTPSAAVYLGAANLAGYLAGALGARRAAAQLGAATTLRLAMALTAASLVACAFPLGFLWFFIWRFTSGCTGGAGMALAAPSVMPHMPAARRGIAGGAIFTGVGLGIAASGTLVPLLIHWGLPVTWLGLGAIAAVLTAVAWNGWPAAGGLDTPAPDPAQGDAATPLGLRALYVQYALNAVGLLPHMVFLVDFIARGLGRGLAAGAMYWIVFGGGALIGPLIGGHIGDRIGFRTTLRATFLLQAGAVALPLLSTAAPFLVLSSFVAGASVPGIVAVTLGRMRELLPGDPNAQAAAWSWCTIAFALGQAIAGYGFSYIFARSANGYPTIFALGAVALLLGLALDFVAAAAVATTPRRAVRE